VRKLRKQQKSRVIEHKDEFYPKWRTTCYKTLDEIPTRLRKWGWKVEVLEKTNNYLKLKISKKLFGIFRYSKDEIVEYRVR